MFRTFTLSKISQAVVTEPRLGHSHPAAFMDTLGFKVALRLGLHEVVFGSHIFTLLPAQGSEGSCDAGFRQAPSRPLGHRSSSIPASSLPRGVRWAWRRAPAPALALNLARSPHLRVQLCRLPALPSRVLSEIRFQFPSEQLPGPVTIPQSSVCAGGTGPRRDRVRDQAPGLQLPAGAFPAPRRRGSGGAGSAAAPLRAGPSRPGAAGAQSAARRSGVGTGAKVSSQLRPRAPPPTPAPGLGPTRRRQGQGQAGPGRAGSFALARAEQPPRPGPSRSLSGRGSRNRRRSPAASRPRHLGGSPSRRLPGPDPGPQEPSCPGPRGAAASPRPGGCAGERHPGPARAARPRRRGCTRRARHLFPGPA